jgi:hypothetical protein
MKILPGAIVTDLAGSLGGQFAQRTGSGLQLSTKPIVHPGHFTTSSQAKALMQQASLRWSMLSEAQRSNWNAIASSWQSQFFTPAKVHRSGFEVFKLLYIRSHMMGLSVITTPLQPTEASIITTLSMTLSVSLNRVFVNVSPAVDGNYNKFLYLTRQYPPTQRPTRQSFVFLAAPRGNNGIAYQVAPQYFARFGALKPGNAITVKAYTVRRSTRARSPIYTATAVVAA